MTTESISAVEPTTRLGKNSKQIQVYINKLLNDLQGNKDFAIKNLSINIFFCSILLVLFSFFLSFVVNSEKCFKKECDGKISHLNDIDSTFITIGKIFGGFGICITSALIILCGIWLGKVIKTRYLK